MRIEVLGEDSINSQARTYAEYRLFAALSHLVDAARVGHARLILRRVRGGPDRESVSCTVTVEIDADATLRVKTTGEHPYAAINQAIERLGWYRWPRRLAGAREERMSVD